MYVKIRSWHIAKDGLSAVCGKPYAVMAPKSNTFGNEKTCESCFRINRNKGHRYAGPTP